MASPLSVFRKYQYIFLVVFGVLLMVAFVVAPPIDDYLRSRGTNSTATNPVVLTSKYGTLREYDLDSMRQAHNLVVLLLEQIIRETYAKDGTPRDPGIPASDSDRVLVHTHLLARKAEAMGMVVSNEAIVEYLEQISDGVISGAEMGAIIQRVLGGRVHEAYLIDRLRVELLAQRMRTMSQAGLFIPPTGAVPPAKAWQYFKRMHSRVQAEIIPLAVADFVDDLERQPTEAEIQAIYDEGKDRFPVPESPEPGFKRRRKAAFQYVRADRDRIEETEKAKIKPQITDEEIEEYYTQNRVLYQMPDQSDDETGEDAGATPEASSPKPDVPSPPGEQSVPAPPSDQPPSASAPETAEPASPETDAGEGAATPSPAASVEPGDPQVEAEHQSSSVGTAPTAEFFVSLRDEPEQTPEAGPGADDPENQKANTAPSTEEGAASDPPSDQPSAPDAAATSQTAETPAETTTEGQDTDGEADEEGPRYRKLDDELREEIREQLAETRARRAAQELLDAAFAELRRTTDRYAKEYRRWNIRTSDDAGREPFAHLNINQLELGEWLEAGETPLVDALTVRDYELGQTRELPEQFTWPPQEIPFAETAFAENLSFYSARQVRSEQGSASFLYWKIKEEQPYVPELAEVRDEVVAVWKKSEALKVAEAEARKLADKARAAGKPLSEVFGQDESLEVVETNQFSWMSTGFTPASMGMPALSHVEGVETIGPEFMESVFALQPGEVGVAINQPQTHVYLVRIASQTPSEDVLRQLFLITGISRDVAYIAAMENLELDQQWYEDLEAEMGVRWQRPFETIQ